jgi:hypothetical protein
LARFQGGQLGLRCVAALVFGFRFAQLAIGSFAQIFELFGFQFACLAGFDVEHKRAVADTADFFDVMADLFEHLAEFSIAAFDENDFIPGVVALANLSDLGGSGVHATRSRLFSIDADAALAQVVELFFSGFATDLDEIGFLHAGGSAGELVGQLAVVGHDQQAFAEVVEAADWVKALAGFREKLHYCGAAFRIADGGDEALGLVEHVVAEALGTLEELAVDADVVSCFVGFGAEFGDDFAVNLDAALGHEFLGVAATGDACPREDLLQALELWCRAGVDGLLDLFGFDGVV